ENLMFSDKLELKIDDFGLAEDVLEYNHIGTPGMDSYRAPEMLAGKIHSCKVDIWSADCVIYQMLVGYDQVFTSINDIIYNDQLSKVAKDLLRRMLTSAPGTRITARDMMDHDFFKGKKQLTLAIRRILQGTRAVQVINGHGVQDHSYIDTRGCKKRRIDPEEEKEFEEEAERWESEGTTPEGVTEEGAPRMLEPPLLPPV
ncbi:Serine/threonine-protein kinase plk1, partial [Haplosporangium gracile]